jgi:ribose transport system substrate-binding protein
LHKAVAAARRPVHGTPRERVFRTYEGGKVTKRLRPVGFIAAVALFILIAGVAGSLAASDASTAIPAGYTGVEAKLPTAFKMPAKRARSCSIGFQNPIAANEFLSFLQKAVVAEGKRYGCRVITLDDALSPDKQVTNMQQLLARKVGVIIFYPLDPKATTPVLRQAQRQGVPVIAIDASFGSTKKVPLITTQVWQSRDTQAYLQAKVLKQVKPNAKVGIIGIGIPVPAIKYLVQRESYWANKAGLTVVGSQDNPSDDVTGGEKAANALLQRHSDINAVIAYNDPSALGAIIAARSAGRKVTVIGLNGSSDGINAVKAGRLAATVQVDPIGIGVQSARAAYSLITKQNLPLPHIVLRPGRLVTKGNVGSIPSWSAQLKAIK